MGPKDPEILEHYGLDDYIYYGWFGWVSRPMLGLLHLFYSFVRNYGIAIVLLTVLVRLCMFPIGRKAAANAKKMQDLAPELKRINEKHKEDPEKRNRETLELYRRHNFNPLGGCGLVFLQLLFGYRGLDELRDAFPDVWAESPAEGLLRALFPKAPSWVIALIAL